jgi:short-subunit dehydrogenase
LNQKVAVVTGSSSGIGFETSLALARNGFYTYATMRNPEKSNLITKTATSEKLPLQALPIDVNIEKSVTDGIDRILNESERIDVLVNNAGFDLTGPLEETSMDEIKVQFETNLFGAIRTMQAVIPTMRKQRSGKIVNITSVGGKLAIPFHSGYHGTKFALEGISESIQYELDPFGIKIIIIEPGAVGSSFWKNMKNATKSSNLTDGESPYVSMMSNMSAALKQMEQNSIPPSEVANMIVNAVTTDNPDFRYVVGKDAIMALEAKANLSDLEFRRLVKKQLNLQND